MKDDECKLPGKAVATASAICLHAIGAAYHQNMPYHIMTIEDGGKAKSLKIPTKALAVLMTVLGEYATGGGVFINPIPNKMNTWYAARVLGMDRIKLLRLLSNEEIPAEGFGRLRQVYLADLIEWNDTREERALQARKALLEKIGVDR